MLFNLIPQMQLPLRVQLHNQQHRRKHKDHDTHPDHHHKDAVSHYGHKPLQLLSVVYFNDMTLQCTNHSFTQTYTHTHSHSLTHSIILQLNNTHSLSIPSVFTTIH
ncbi:hypothetical protein EWB00_004152 [Schistosoma japonicum]|uniref:Uncharacterized protein n=1 Tax=Schistosoma japonicum TaxID=6182 RepID=A0A4Z2D693_SCHJA|nr:hypothetical protein EWB00_004152 [Schistosoma japonicum]